MSMSAPRNFNHRDRETERSSFDARTRTGVDLDLAVSSSRWCKSGFVALCLLGMLGTASAEPRLVYVEALGKAGVYGVGYEQGVTERVSLGFAGSYARLRSQDLAMATPYVHVAPLVRGRDALFGELGLELAYSKLESAVPRWMGTSTTAVGGIASVGYEHAFKRLVVRGALSLLAGKGGMAPWAGLAIGVRP